MPLKEIENSSEEIYTWLCSFINLERGLGGGPSSPEKEQLKLDRMKMLANLAGNPERSAHVFHAAGSKGKGSVCALFASVLEAAGIKTARYMSPHVSIWRERITRGNRFFPEAVYRAAGKELRAVYEAYRQKYLAEPGQQDEPGEPTFFELCTLYFFLCARHDKAGFMAVETGLGGRLDATNIVDPAVSVITPIEKEHTAWLGNTLEAIAAEKAGIIKPGRPVISAKQEAEVLEVLKETAEERGSPFYYLSDHAEITDCRVHSGGTDFAVRFSRTLCPDMDGKTLSGLSVSMPGAVYAENATLAFAAFFLSRAAPAIPDVFRKGLSAVSLPARFEKLKHNPPFIADGAHTPSSVSRCAETFCLLYGRGSVLLFGCAADKDPKSMAEILVPLFSRCIITGTGNFRTSDPAAVYAAFTEAAQSLKKAGGNYPVITLADEPKAAAEEARKAGLPVLCCGSFYLAAEIRFSEPLQN